MENTLLIVITWIIAALSIGFSGYLFYEYSIEWEIMDPYSYSNTKSVTTDHFDLRLELDFDNQIITGEQTLHMRTLTYLNSEVILDIDMLDIKEIIYNVDTPLTYKLTKTKPEIGQALNIKIPYQLSPGSEFTLTVKYVTNPEAAALSWLFSNQTESKKLPYLFSSCETTHARSLVPLQDSPTVKSTFNAKVLSPPLIKVRMSGNTTGEFNYDNFRMTTFESTIPIPSYALAIVAGDLVEQKIGNRTTVIAESTNVATYAKVLASFESWLAIAEKYLTPYQWGDFKIVVQPKIFPYTGIENPLLSSISSSLLVGDTPSVMYAIHELAHSWAGNLVTHESWVHVWLKEGISTFVERKVAQLINGQAYYRIYSLLGNDTLYQTIKSLGENSPLTSLYPKADAITQADSIMTSVQSEKGFQFLVYIESKIGESSLQEFLISYFNNFKYTSINTNDFKDYLIKFIYKKFESETARQIYDQMDFDKWLVDPGVPPHVVDLTNSDYTNAIALAEDYIIRAGASRPTNYKDFTSYSVPLKSIFLEHFLKNTTRLSVALVTKIYTDLSLGYLTNPDHITLFMEIAVLSGYYASPFRYPSEYVANYGRLELIYPVFVAMAQKDKVAAQDIYKTYTVGCKKGVAGECRYHPIARKMIEQAIGL